MNLIEALPLGILEGVTELLPVSSTGHLTIAEGLLGLKVDDPGVTAFNAIIQVGTILAVIIYFRSDIGRLASAWLRGLVNGQACEGAHRRLLTDTYPSSALGCCRQALQSLTDPGLFRLPSPISRSAVPHTFCTGRLRLTAGSAV